MRHDKIEISIFWYKELITLMVIDAVLEYEGYATYEKIIYERTDRNEEESEIDCTQAIFKNNKKCDGFSFQELINQEVFEYVTQRQFDDS